jgi:valyl-tRNA synthetase
LIQDSYPIYNPALEDEKAVKEMALLQGIIGQIRTVRSQFNVPPSLKIKVILNTKEAEEKIINKYSSYIKTLAKVETLEVGQNMAKPKQSASAVFEETTIYIPLEGLIDFEKENARLNKELLNIQNALKNRERMLSNPSFLNNAPKEQVAKAQDELKVMKEKEIFLQTAIKDLK